MIRYQMNRILASHLILTCDKIYFQKISDKLQFRLNFVRLAVFQIQLSSFTVFVPLVFTTIGGMAPEAPEELLC